jgi:hypothetical protein
MIQHFSEITEEENYYTRSMANNTIKINCLSVETYRKMIAFMKEKTLSIIRINPKMKGLIK